MRRLLLLSALAAAPLGAQTAADSAAVRQASVDYLDGFYEGDSTKHVRSIRPEVYKYGFGRSRDAAAYNPGQQMTWPQFHAFSARVKASGKAPDPKWPKKVEVMDVLDQTAATKVTAWWGTDYLLMGKFDGKWMITHVLWQSPPPARRAASR
ncbi:nuclear transport factor 2 family protein [Roseisolibacter sp. H3M3-2]|uniref:nuclear transport factor 2 family protein n=1 Tax=Roseisolibacter sp. H3M3-2 TaxID=3031323 RepID=UPI0023D9A4B5|nr:nuclear transport factor 2 family protein [Roseisolibacter sp. H3M3-2]MDF1504510.1 nuclear transport factor 2 family protein [Roseisolibacter sp. H3M3-2]